MTFLNGMIVAGSIATQLTNGQGYTPPANSYALCNMSVYGNAVDGASVVIRIGGMVWSWAYYSNGWTTSWGINLPSSIMSTIFQYNVAYPSQFIIPAGVLFSVESGFTNHGVRLTGQLIANKA